MKMGIFTLYDTKSEMHGRPFFSENRGAAIRSIQMSLKADPKSVLSQYPGDFGLFDLGTFDDENGIFESHSPVFVLTVSELVTEVPQNVQ